MMSAPTKAARARLALAYDWVTLSERRLVPRQLTLKWRDREIKASVGVVLPLNCVANVVTTNSFATRGSRLVKPPEHERAVARLSRMARPTI